MHLKTGSSAGRLLLVLVGSASALVYGSHAALSAIRHTVSSDASASPTRTASRGARAELAPAGGLPPVSFPREASQLAESPLSQRPAPTALAEKAARGVSAALKQQDDEALEQWTRESIDENASLELSDHIEESLRDLEMAGKVLVLSCRKTLCRLQMQFGTLADAQRFSEQAGSPERRKRLDMKLDDEDGVLVDVIVARPL